MENVISIQNLNKSFGNVKAVDDLSFRVKRGELFAFLGVNGAGKSTDDLHHLRAAEERQRQRPDS